MSPVVSVNGERNSGLAATPVSPSAGGGLRFGAPAPNARGHGLNIKPRSRGRKNKHLAGLCPFVSEPPPHAQTKRESTLTPVLVLDTKKNLFSPYLFVQPVCTTRKLAILQYQRTRRT